MASALAGPVSWPRRGWGGRSRSGARKKEQEEEKVAQRNIGERKMEREAGRVREEEEVFLFSTALLESSSEIPLFNCRFGVRRIVCHMIRITRSF